MYHSGVVEDACMSIRHMVSGSADMCTRFGELGVCKLVVQALNTHIRNADVVVQSAYAIRNLSFENIDNQSAFSCCDASETVVRALEIQLLLSKCKLTNVEVITLFTKHFGGNNAKMAKVRKP